MSALPASEKLFAFTPEDEWLMYELGKLLREVLQAKALGPRQLVDFGLLLNAIARLPRATPEIFLDFSLTYSFNNESTWTDLHISDQAFRLGSGFSIYDPQIGSDHSTHRELMSPPWSARSRLGQRACWASQSLGRHRLNFFLENQGCHHWGASSLACPQSVKPFFKD